MRTRIDCWIIALVLAVLCVSGCNSATAYPIGITQPSPDLEGAYHSTNDVDGLGALTLLIERIEGRQRDEVYAASLRSEAGLFASSANGTGTVGDNHAAFDFSVGQPGEFYASIEINQVSQAVTGLTITLVFPDQAETLTIDFVPVS